jgi:hypothetical protein
MHAVGDFLRPPLIHEDPTKISTAIDVAAIASAISAD